jgi:Na+-transporting NADH:ubiquinone oxidoreductase subunit B
MGLGLKKFVPLLIVSYLSGGIIEVIFAQIREEPVSEGYFVTGLLIPLIIPVDTPLWMVALAAGFAVLFGKEVFGGTGMNIFNPALLARAFLFFSYPAKMSGDKVWITGLPDAISQATPLGQLSQATSVSQLVSIHQHFSVADMFWGLIPGSIGETSTFAILLGGLFLIFVGIASWKIIVSAFVGGGLMAGLFNLLGSSTNMMMHIPFYEHWLLGGFAFGMVYMLTDPVSATHTEAGKWIYGFLAGSFAIFLRVVNPAYPEGVMLSILLMNAFAPLIDYIVLQFHIKRRAKIARLLNQKYLNYEN